MTGPVLLKCRAIAGYFLTPISVQVGHRMSALARSHLPSKEGRGVSWLRYWVNGLGFGTNRALAKPD